MIPIFYRSHIFAFCKYADEVRLIVEATVIAYLGCTQRSAGKKVAGLGDTQIVDICYE